jgi:multidrug efflux pump subunit AcrA (membrane-fusion protein)
MMNKTFIKNPNPRTKIYAALVFFSIIAVLIRIALVQADRSRSIVSFVAEWNRHGKPVAVKEIKAADTPVYAKFTVFNSADKLAAGFVTKDIKDKLKIGQEIYFTEGDVVCGKILTLGQELDLDTGMFPVEVKLNTPAVKLGSISVVFARIQIMQKVLVVPNSILDISQGNYYLWKVDNGKARRVQVKIGSRNGYGTVISEGINSGDLIVFNGRSILLDNDSVNIVSNDVALRLSEIKGGKL